MNIKYCEGSSELMLRAHDENERKLLRAITCVALDGGSITVFPKGDPEGVRLTWHKGGERVPEPSPPITWRERLTSGVWLRAFATGLFRRLQ